MGYKLKRMLMWVNQARLPSEYQEVEYIQSSGTQYINTLVNPTSSTKVQTKIMVTGTSENGGPIYGVFYNFASNTRFCGWYENGGVWFGYGGNNGGNNIVQVGMNTNITIEQYTSGGVSHNIVNGTDNSYSGASFTAQNYPMFLFARNNSTSDIDRRLYLKMYYFKIYSGDTLVRNFVPCYRKSDNVIGMYDLVNSAFYTNAGSGTFSKGNDVTMVEKQVYPKYEWKPDSSRTLIYYPLTSDLKDVMGNGNNGTSHGTLSFNEITGIRFTGTSGNYVTGMSNGIANKNKFTMNVWVKCTTNSNTKILLGYNSNTPSSQCMYIAYEGGVLRLVGFYGSSWSYAIVGNIGTDTNWHNVCLVATGTKYQLYVDNVAIGEGNTSSNNMNNYSELQLGWGGYYRSGRACDGYAKSYIVENYAWSEEDRTKYYEWSKEKLGI